MISVIFSEIRLDFILFNSSDTGDRIVRLWGSIPCLLMPWLLKSLEHHQAWYWLCRTDNIYCCSRVNSQLPGSNEIQDAIQNVNISFVSFKQFSMLRVNYFCRSKIPFQLWHHASVVHKCPRHGNVCEVSYRDIMMKVAICRLCCLDMSKISLCLHQSAFI